MEPEPGPRERARANGVVLLPYDEAWPDRYAEAEREILEACGTVVVGMEHVGSTAIPGIHAKPYLDLMPGLQSYDDGAVLVPLMQSLGYEYKGEYGIAGRHYFSKWIEDDDHVWKHNVHTYAVGHYEWVRHLVFRDVLRNDPNLRDEYQALKLLLALKHANDVEAYAEAKSEFVERVIAMGGGPSRPPAD